jgi:hypothetical protein
MNVIDIGHIRVHQHKNLLEIENMADTKCIEVSREDAGKLCEVLWKFRINNKEKKNEDMQREV